MKKFSCGMALGTGLPAQYQELSSETRADPVRTLSIKPTNGSSQHAAPSRDWLFTLYGNLDREKICDITAKIACPARPSVGPRPDDRAPGRKSRCSLYRPVYFQVSLHLVTRVSLALGSVVICNTAFEYKGSTGNLSLAAIQTWVAAAYRKSCTYFLALTGVTQRWGCS